ncbi:MAG: purine phosphoribosyltransferase family protein [Candidatus Altiarchaeales archaeon]|nr:purine phosphoribosyltransferase family protein [Candidatus Altiarchaeales archaeon]
MAKPRLPLLEESLRNSKVVKRGEYSYFVHPLTDTIPPIKPELLDEICEGILKVADTSNVDVLVTMEAMGIHIAAVLSQKTGIPFNVIRKKQYWLPGEIVLDQSTGYSKGKMYINGIKKGDRILLVDAVVSTGGTLAAVIKGLQKAGAEIKDIVCVIERGEGRKTVEEKTGHKVKTLVKIDIAENKVRILK